jgi:hypothetical protein
MKPQAKTADLEKLKAAIHASDPNITEDAEAFQAALVLLAAADMDSTSVAPLTAATGVPYALVRKFVRNLKLNGVFRGGKIHHSGWDDEQHGGIAFWMDVCVAEGLMIRSVDRTEAK